MVDGGEKEWRGAQTIQRLQAADPNVAECDYRQSRYLAMAPTRAVSAERLARRCSGGKDRQRDADGAVAWRKVKHRLG